MLKTKFNELKKKYSQKGSWAIWNHHDMSLADIATSHLCEAGSWQHPQTIRNLIRNNTDILRTDVVIMGLNASKECDDWRNYHFGGAKKDSYLMLAFDRSTFRGLYMTDVFISKEKRANNAVAELENPEKKQLAAKMLLKELKDIGTTKNTFFICLGDDAFRLFRDITKNSYPFCMKITHCSAPGQTMFCWVRLTWDAIKRFTIERPVLPQFEISIEMEKLLEIIRERTGK